MLSLSLHVGAAASLCLTMAFPYLKCRSLECWHLCILHCLALACVGCAWLRVFWMLGCWALKFSLSKILIWVECASHDSCCGHKSLACNISPSISFPWWNNLAPTVKTPPIMLLFLPKRWRNLMLLHWKTWPHGIMLMLADIMQLPMHPWAQLTVMCRRHPPRHKNKNLSIYIYNIIELIN